MCECSGRGKKIYLMFLKFFFKRSNALLSSKKPKNPTKVDDNLMSCGFIKRKQSTLQSHLDLLT